MTAIVMLLGCPGREPASPAPSTLVDAGLLGADAQSSPADAAADATPAAPTADVPDAALEAAPLTATTRQLRHRGVNLSGGEFGACCPGRYGTDYAFPSKLDFDQMAARGATHVRLPFRHERLQRSLRGELDAVEWQRIEEALRYATGKGMTVALEPHNSARFNSVIVKPADLADLWRRVAQRLQAAGLGDGRVWPNLTNEPHDMRTEDWLAIAQASVSALRSAGYRGSVVVPGNGWTGAGHWTSSWYGTPNSTLMQRVTDPGAVFEVHLYLDTNADGRGADCVSPTIGVERLRGFVAWLKAHGRLGYLGEIGAPATPTCEAAVKNALASIEAEPMIWTGWAWWSAGYRWSNSYPLSLEPLPVDAGAPNAPVADRTQLDWIRPLLLCGAR